MNRNKAMRNATRNTFAALVATALLQACATPVDPQSSGIEPPGFWTRLAGEEAETDAPLIAGPRAQVEHEWWRHFGDSTLEALIAEALANNKTLRIARTRVEEARAGRGIARSALFPEIVGTAGASRSNQGYLTNDQEFDLAEAGLAASWELDLFGRNRARTAQATAILQSEEAEAQAVSISLLAEVARNYFDLRNFQRQIALTEANLATQRRTLELIEAQLEAGFAGDFDVQRAGAQVSTTEALIPSLYAAHDAALARVDILLGRAPGTADTAIEISEELAQLDQHVVVAAPATVLASRPDVRAAERRFAASIAARNAAAAELFPNISLTAFFGVQDAEGVSATPWGIGANLVQPILNFGRIRSQINAADSREQQAFLAYQQAVLEALEDMENALSRYLRETERNASLASAVAQDRRAAELARQQYTNGFVSLLDVLVAERDLLLAEANQADSDANLRKNLVAVYAAAGGGWPTVQ
jgi:multidrug efflux system outer membrane protein